MMSGEEDRAKLIEELEELAEKLKSTRPKQTLPPYSSGGLFERIERRLLDLTPQATRTTLDRLRTTIKDDLLDEDTWKGIWYVVNYSLESQADFLKRRVQGEYETDEWGLDSELVDLVEPFFDFMHKNYWRVETGGLENIPEEGRALLVCNHSGQVLWDGAMLGTAVYYEHPAQRRVRTLYASWLSGLPFFSLALNRLGQAPANEENGLRLLEQEQLVAVFPGENSESGQLSEEHPWQASFDRADFVRMALKTGSPIIPVAIVSTGEIAQALNKARHVRSLVNPLLSSTYPRVSPLGFIPIPLKWSINFGAPVPVEVSEGQSVDDPALILQLADQTMSAIRHMVQDRLEQPELDQQPV